MFFHSDVLRDAHKVFRSVQFLRTYLPNDLASSARAAKADISLDDFTVALHKWMVQLRWHFGSYRFAAQKKDEAASGLPKNVEPKGASALCTLTRNEETNF